MKQKEVYVPIKDWDEEDRPREKLIKLGSRSLSNSELLAIVLGSGSVDESALSLSRRILQQYGNDLSTLAKLEIADFKKFKGVGDAKAVALNAVFELSKRVEFRNETKKKITCSNDAFSIIKEDLVHLKVEEFWVAILNRSNQVVLKKKISSGGVAGTVVDIKLIVKLVVENLASGVILFHNHPSGNLKPSNEDLNLTRKIKDALSLLDVILLDHLIVCNSDFLSFADENILNQ